MTSATGASQPTPLPAPDRSQPRVRRRRRAACRTASSSRPTAVLVLALGYPLVRQVVLSLQEYGLAQQFGQPAPWVGLDNYRALVTDAYLWKVVLRSVVFCLVNAAVTMALGWASRC